MRICSKNSTDQEQRSEEIKLSYDLYLKAFFITKIATYFMLIVWYWRSPVASVPQNLVQPFGRFLSWKAGDSLNDKIMVKGSDKKGRVCCLGKVPTFMWLSLQLKGP
ncbi:hypothetical protein SLE2022_006750 [Rubroshorea leprosula]